MTMHARGAGFAAALLLVAAPRIEAQSSSIRVTIAGGQHAGTHELKGDHCRVLNGQIRAVFTPEGGTVGSGTPEFIELYTVPGKGKSDGFGVRVLFLLESGRQTVYEIHATPPGLQGPTPPSGRGSVAVRQAETGKTATFRGATKDEVRMEGSVDCRNDL
ncbi:MAG TPA: hypothetical protein VMN37_05255 [Gemmatimonadales bacterium]|nr:hypothetical protein [Gemmatimonadales bacterium]